MAEQICEYCGKANPSREPYCFSCGMLLPAGRQQGDTHILPPEAPPIQQRMGSAFFGARTVLRLQWVDRGDVVETHFEGECVLGRAGEGAAPDVDLTPFDAKVLGVSRRHVKLVLEGNIMMVSDLGGINGTYLNGQRLLPYQPRILRSDDLLTLGQLGLRVAFATVAPQAAENAPPPPLNPTPDGA